MKAVSLWIHATRLWWWPGLFFPVPDTCAFSPHLLLCLLQRRPAGEHSHLGRSILGEWNRWEESTEPCTEVERMTRLSLACNGVLSLKGDNGHTDTVEAVKFQPKSSQELCSAGDDKSIRWVVTALTLEADPEGRSQAMGSTRP